MALDNNKKDLKRPESMSKQTSNKKSADITPKELPKQNKGQGVSHSERIERARKVISESFLRELLFTEDSEGNIVENSSVTDISFNGTDMYIQDNEVGRYKVDSEKDPRIRAGKKPLMVTPEMVENLGNQVQNTMGDVWNTTSPILDSELGELRTNFMHKAVSPFGVTFALRVSRPRLAITDISTLCDPDTAKLLEVFMRCDFNLLISGQTGSGKALTNSSRIPTPTGWTTMGDLKVGDYVFDRLGKPTKITGVFPQGLLDVYKVTLKDGRVVYCNDEHIWTTVSDKGVFHNYTVREMLDMGIYGKKENHARFYIPTSKSVEYVEANLPIDPYVLGAMLGDGAMKEVALTIHSDSDFIPNKIASKIGCNEIFKLKHGFGYNFRLPEELVTNELKKNYSTVDILGSELANTHGRDKYIPEIYKVSSVEQRLDLVRGLLDTDGTISTKGKVSFSNNSLRLIEDLKEVLQSLGYTSSIVSYVRENYKNVTYQLLINMPNKDKHLLFSLPRKYERALGFKDKYIRARHDRIVIVNIEKMEYTEEMTCIMVDNKEHLFLAEDFVVTHNTELQKALIGYIPEQKKISLMEDTLDSHIKEIYPHKDINSWATAGERGSDNYVGFPDLIRAGLRNNPDWLMISEVRGAEAQDLLSAALTGHSIMTTLHATGADNIPSRLSNMVSMNEQSSDYEALQLDIVSVLNLGLHMEKVDDPITGKISRIIREIYEYTEYRQGIGIIGVPIYEVKQNYNPETQEYVVKQVKNRLSDGLLEKIKNKREIHNVPDDYSKGNSY